MNQTYGTYETYVERLRRPTPNGKRQTPNAYFHLEEPAKNGKNIPLYDDRLNRS
jgi:uncharacterized short protein YbdD (DUF466 family)